MKTQRDEKFVDLAQLLLGLDIAASASVEACDEAFFAWVTLEVDDNGVHARMMDHRARKLVPSCKKSYPFSKRLRWTRKRQSDDIMRQMLALDPRSLLFLRSVRVLTLSAARENTKYWSRSVRWRRVQDGQCVELRTTTQGYLHAQNSPLHVQGSQYSDNVSRFHVIQEPTLESGPLNRLIMAFPVCQYGVGHWTKNENSYSFTYKKPSPFKFLLHADRWGALDPARPQCRIHRKHEMTDFHTRAMARGFQKLSNIPSLRYTWMQYLLCRDSLQSFCAQQGCGTGYSTICTALPRWLSLLPILETENDPDRNQLHAITDLRLSLEKEVDLSGNDLVPDIANVSSTFFVSVGHPPRPPSPRRTRRHSNNLHAAVGSTLAPSIVSAAISSEYRRSDMETLLRDYALNLLPKNTITAQLQSLVRESKSAAWYAKFFFLRPQYEDLQSRIARLLLLVYTKRVEHPGFQTAHNDEWRKLIESLPFIPLASGELLSWDEAKHLQSIYAPQDEKGGSLVDKDTDLKQLPGKVLDRGVWRNQDCRKFFDAARWVHTPLHGQRMSTLKAMIGRQERGQPVAFGGGLLA